MWGRYSVMLSEVDRSADMPRRLVTKPVCGQRYLALHGL